MRPSIDERSSRSAHQTSFADQTPLFSATFVVLDLETTGLSPEKDRITEVGAVRARGGEVLAELRTFVHPGVPIPAAVTAITGITDKDVAGAPDLATVFPIVMDFLGNAVFVAHNARFDLSFLRAAAQRLGLAPIRPRVIDTAVLARRLIRDEVRDLRLGTLAQHFRVPDTPDHRALHDARATLHVLHALIERASAYGVTSIEDLEHLCGPTGDRSHRKIGLIADAPSAPGVYRFLAEDDTVLYVGKATDLRRRLRSYFGNDTRRRTADLVAATHRITWTVVATELEAAVREVRELQAHRPRYNHRSTRPDAGVTVALTQEPFPRLAIVRGAPDDEREGLGPVPRAIAERAVEALEAVLPLRPCRPRLRRAQDNPACILKDLHRCDAVCDGTQTPDAYAAVVARTQAMMRDPEPLLDTLSTQMRAFAAAGEYERAAACREQLAAIVRAYDARRHHDLMRHSGITVLERSRTVHDGSTRTTVTDVITLHDGRLVASTVESGHVLAWPGGRAADEEPHAMLHAEPSPGREETDLIRRWCASDDVRIRHTDGVFASALSGGAALARLRSELREAERSTRGDDVLLARGKVRRRAAAEEAPRWVTAD